MQQSEIMVRQLAASRSIPSWSERSTEFSEEKFTPLKIGTLAVDQSRWQPFSLPGRETLISKASKNIPITRLLARVGIREALENKIKNTD